MPTDAPSNLPPVLRPDAPPVHTLDELAARFGLEVRGETAGVTLTGVTLATADLRPGDVFVAVRGVNRHGAEFTAAAAEKGKRSQAMLRAVERLFKCDWTMAIADRARRLIKAPVEA